MGASGEDSAGSMGNKANARAEADGAFISSETFSSEQRAQGRLEQSVWRGVLSRREAGLAEAGLAPASEAASRAGLFKAEMETAFQDTLIVFLAEAREAGSALLKAMRPAVRYPAGVNFGEVVASATASRKALETLTREAARQGLLSAWLAGVSEELSRPHRAPLLAMTRQAAVGLMELWDSSHDQKAGESHSDEAGSISHQLSNWAGDFRFWNELGADVDRINREHRAFAWSLDVQEEQELSWGSAMAQALSIACRSSADREAALGLAGRLGALLEGAALSRSWSELGREGLALAEVEGLEAEGVQEVILATPPSYWLGLREELVRQIEPSKSALALSGMILETMLSIAGRSEPVEEALARHLWLTLDTDGLWRWEGKSPSAPLRALSALEEDWGSHDAAMSLRGALKSPSKAWIIPAFESAGLTCLDPTGDLSVWFDEDFEERVKNALEGVFALMQRQSLSHDLRGPVASKERGRSL